MTQLPNVILTYLPQILFGVAALALILFSIISIVGGYSLKHKIGSFKSLKGKAAASSTILEKIWRMFVDGLLTFFRFFGLFPKKPIFQTFRQATKWLKEHIDRPDSVYYLPWYAVLGDTASGKSTLVDHLPLKQPAEGETFSDDLNHPALTWHFFDKGVLLDIAGGCFTNSKLFSKYRSWNSVLRNLARFRPRRPLDGIILTIPATYFTGETALSDDEIALRAQTIAKQLRDTEKKLGLKLPIYILITKSDAIAGFSGTCNVLPSQYLQQVFGWSNPYSLDSTYSDQWVGDAFSDMYGALTNLSINIFESVDVSEYKDDVMVLAPEFLNIQSGLQKYLDIIFRTYSYHYQFYLRGIYFTGNYFMQEVEKEVLSSKEGAGLTPPTIPGTRIKLPFLQELFNNKIYAESAIATPIRKFLVSANHKINWMKALISVAAVGAILCLHIGQTQIKDTVRTLYPDFQKMYQTIYTIKLYEENKVHADEKRRALFFQNNAPYVLNAMVNYETQDLHPYYLPASWLTFLNQRIESSLKIAFNEIITQSMFIDFMEKANNIIRHPLPALSPDNTINSIIAPLETSDFLILQGYVDALTRLETNLTLYSKLNQFASIEDFATVVNFLYNFTFQSQYLNQHSDFIEKMLRSAKFTPFNLQNYQLLAQERLYTLFMTFLRRILDPKFNYTFLGSLQNILNKVDGTQSNPATLPQLKKALKMLEHVQKIASNPEMAWLGKGSFDPGNKFDQVRAGIVSSSLFGKQFVRALSTEASAVYKRSQQDLKSYGSPLTGYFLNVSAITDQIDVSEGMKSLTKNLLELLALPFMQETPQADYDTAISPDQVMFWDTTTIKLAAALVSDYRDFVKDELPNLHPDLQESVKLLAQEMLQKNVTNMVARSQKVITIQDAYLESAKEAYQHSHLTNLLAVGPDFLNLLEQLTASENYQIFVPLKSLIFQQLMQGLQDVDRMLMERALYEPFYQSFDWWTGNKNVVFQAYDMLDQGGMKSFFENQTKQIISISDQLATPLVKFLNNQVFDLDIAETKLIEKWRNIIEDVSAFKAKKSKNPIALLEKFLSDTGNKIVFDTCFKDITPEMINTTSSDFFVQKKIAVQTKIYDQCTALSSQHAINKFNTLSNYFNSNLAGNFPFVSTINKSSLPENESTPQNIMTFFALYDALNSHEMSALKNATKFDNIETIMLFLNKVKDVKDFLDTYFLPKTQAGEPGIDFDIQFRANQIHELFGHHVINWGFVAGNKTYELKTGQSKGRWEYGQIAAFAFKWANDSPLRPLNTAIHNPAYSNIQNRAVFLYEGPWAFLRAVMLNQATIRDGAMPGDSTLLEFSVPVSPDPRNPVPTAHAKLFVKFIPQTPKKLVTTKFSIPVFPAVAPVLQLKS